MSKCTFRVFIPASPMYFDALDVSETWESPKQLCEELKVTYLRETVYEDNTKVILYICHNDAASVELIMRLTRNQTAHLRKEVGRMQAHANHEAKKIAGLKEHIRRLETK